MKSHVKWKATINSLLLLLILLLLLLKGDLEKSTILLKFECLFNCTYAANVVREYSMHILEKGDL